MLLNSDRLIGPECLQQNFFNTIWFLIKISLDFVICKFWKNYHVHVMTFHRAVWHYIAPSKSGFVNGYKCFQTSSIPFWCTYIVAVCQSHCTTSNPSPDRISFPFHRTQEGKGESTEINLTVSRVCLLEGQNSREDIVLVIDYESFNLYQESSLCKDSLS